MAKKITRAAILSEVAGDAADYILHDSIRHSHNMYTEDYDEFARLNKKLATEVRAALKLNGKKISALLNQAALLATAIQKQEKQDAIAQEAARKAAAKAREEAEQKEKQKREEKEARMQAAKVDKLVAAIVKKLKNGKRAK